jgi:hypothetical protein
LKYLKPNAGAASGRELIKIVGTNLHDKLQVFWNDTPIEFVCKDDTEIWCGSLPGPSRTTAVILVKERDGGSQPLYFTYQNFFNLPVDIDGGLMEVEDRMKTVETKVVKTEYIDERKSHTLTPEKQDLIKEKERVPEKVESELERNVAVSLASLSDTFMRGNASTLVNETAISNAKRARNEGRTKLVCKKCRYVLCADVLQNYSF